MIFGKQYRSYNKRGAFKHFDGAAFLMEFVADGKSPFIIDFSFILVVQIPYGKRCFLA